MDYELCMKEPHGHYAGSYSAMKTKTHHTRSATTAIVAALALGSTALAAQTVTPPADPPIVQPEASPATAPVVIAPNTQTGPTTTEAPSATASTPVLISPVAVPQSTVAETAPVQSETAPPPAAQSARAARQAPAPAEETAAPPAAQRSAAQAGEAEPSALSGQEETTFVPPAAPAAAVGAVPAVPPAAMTDPTPPAGQTANQVALLTGIFFIVLLMGLALFTYVYWRRRSSATAVPTIVRPTVSQKPEPASAAKTVLTLETAASIAREHPEAPLEQPASTDNVATIHAAPAKAASGDSTPVTLPAALPDRFEERDALIKQMVEAEPDKANPFRSRKARLRRARLILQSLSRKFDGREPWIDLSQYTRDWSSMARRQHSPA